MSTTTYSKQFHFIKTITMLTRLCLLIILIIKENLLTSASHHFNGLIINNNGVILWYLFILIINNNLILKESIDSSLSLIFTLKFYLNIKIIWIIILFHNIKFSNFSLNTHSGCTPDNDIFASKSVTILKIFKENCLNFWLLL